jgi:hypothetical protein
MKNILVLLALHTAVSGTVIYTQNFEAYDTSINNLEDQALDGNGIPIWETGPFATETIGAINSASVGGLPVSFGDKVLAVGGFAPSTELFEPGEVYLFTPADFTYAIPTTLPGSRDKEVVVSMDMLFSDPNVFTDSFRFAFFDTANAGLGSLLFTPGVSGSNLKVFRDNLNSTFDTQFDLGINTAVTLDIVINLEFGKWSASITPVGTQAAVALFANVDMTDPSRSPQPLRELGGMQVAWIGTEVPVANQMDPTNPLDPGNYIWGDNTLILDNISLTAIPEPSSALLLGGFSIFALFRRSRKA